MFFKKRNDKKMLESSSINPIIMSGFLNKIEDIICIVKYDGNFVTVNKDDIKFHSLQELLNEKQNKELYSKIITTVKEEGCYQSDIEIEKEDRIVKMYIAAYDIKSQSQIFCYIKDTNKYFEKEAALQEEIERKDEYLKSKDLFVANLSHEIKTPINAIVGMIYFLKETMLDEKQLEYVKKLEDASNMLLEMVNGILDLSSDKNYSEVNSKVDFNLKKCIDNAVEMLEEKAKSKDLKIYVNYNIDEDINIYADKGRISQVFVNLINNAIKYTDRGYIELNARLMEETNVSYKFQFCVRDTGIGIKKEDTLKIFREFQQVDDPTRKVREGKGMGLAITKKIVEDMQGKMWVESSVGLGSKFYFYFVVDKSSKNLEEIEESENEEYDAIETQIEDTDVENVGQGEAKENARILLVEDNEMNIEITTKIIQDLGYQIEVARDGIEAIKKVKEEGKKYFDLILMDIHMPRYNGYEISKILKKDMGVEVPIVALTATVITDKIIRENAEYILDYIQKPVKPEILQEKVKKYLRPKVEIQEKDKKHILLIGEVDERLDYIKKKLSSRYVVATTKSELDTQILLETGNIDIILVDELKDLKFELKFINNIKCTEAFSKIPIILINNKLDDTFRDKVHDAGFDNIIEKNEVDKCYIAIDNILKKKTREQKLVDTIQTQKAEKADVYNFLFDSLINVTASRSKETGMHLKRLRKYMGVMLKKYEEFYKEEKFTNKEVIEDISMAAALHDIGKIGIPDNILNKPGRLTDEEYEIMKSHVTIGRDILDTSYGNKLSNNIMKYARDIVYHHHEKYNGTGYPEHLKGDQITLVSRIMALIDVYDALANPRVYKPAMPYDEVEKFIKEQAGIAFDPKVVNIFELVKDELKTINENNKDEEEKPAINTSEIESEMEKR